MPLLETKGAGSAQGFGLTIGATASASAIYIEDVFSAYTYTGTGASLTITNNINLSASGGLTWIKSRSAATDHKLTDTARGVTKALISNSTGGQTTDTTGLTAFGTTGFTIGANADYNTSAATYVSWTWRKQPKYFDIQTWTGNGANRTIAHSLGAVPGSIWVKRTDTTADWQVYHRSLANTQYLVLNDSVAVATGATRWNSTTPTSSVFSLGTDVTVNASAGTYVAYIFAHDAGGFGLTGTDNVISCGTFTTDGSAYANVTLGYEPQLVLQKRTDGVGNWNLNDSMRGMTTFGGQVAQLFPSVANLEGSGTGGAHPTATGFESTGLGVSQNYIYIAIRRGPMKVPTLGTSVFSPNIWTGNDTARSITGTNFSPDLTLIRDRSAATGYSFVVNDKLRGSSNVLRTFNNDSETAGITQGVTSFNMDGISLGTDSSNYGYNRSPNPEIGEFFARAPSFFDEVCYTGTATYTTFTHNLTVAPQLVIIKSRANGNAWVVGSSLSPSASDYIRISSTAAWTTGTFWDNSSFVATRPTATTVTISPDAGVNASGITFVAYLFATCAGVSKVGSYTGTGTTQTINCGFTAGSRFIMIKRTDSTGDWYVWDSARGIVAGNDPYLFINDAAAEVTGTDYVDTANSGFEISSTAPAAINANGGIYIFLAIA